MENKTPGYKNDKIDKECSAHSLQSGVTENEIFKKNKFPEDSHKLRRVVLVFQKIIRKIFVFPIAIYQKLFSKALNAGCLYHPSCSEYTKNSILKLGIIPGVILGITRIFRCNGWFFAGGDDETPNRFSFKYIGESYKRFLRKRKNL